MPNEVVGFKINGSAYEYDHEHLANLPTIDATPTANSTNAVQSGGVKSALDGIQAEIPTVDAVPTQGSSNAVRSGGVYSALAGKVDAETGKGLSTNDYSDAEKAKVTNADTALTAITTATTSDEGKALKAKTVTNGKVVEWEFGETGGAEIESITNRFEKLCADGSGGFDSALFVNGGMSNGQVLPAQKYRVATYEFFSFDRDVTISSETGYRFGAHIFIDGAFDSDSGWKTSLDVSVGTTFKIVIAKQTEDTSVVADIEEFVNAIDISTFVSDTRKQVEQLDEELTGEITDLQSEIDRLKSKSLPASVASAILQVFKGVAWASENGGQMINTLHDALFGSAKNYTLYDYITPTADHPFRKASGIAAAVDFEPTCSIETTVLYTNAVKTNAANILGSKNSASGKVIGLYATPSSGKLSYWYFGKDTVNNITPLSANQKTTISIKPVGASEAYPDNVVIDVDGTEYNSGVTNTSYDCSPWLGFFNYAIGEGEINGSGVMYDIGLRIGRTIVRSANGVMRNCFIPAHDGTRYGLYDSMNDRFFYNETYADKYTCGYWEQEGGD